MGIDWESVCEKNCVYCIHRGLWSGVVEENPPACRAPEVVIAGTASWQRRWDDLGRAGQRHRVVVKQVHCQETCATLVGSLAHRPECSVVGELTFASHTPKCVRQVWRVAGPSPPGFKPASQGRVAYTPSAEVQTVFFL